MDEAKINYVLDAGIALAFIRSSAAGIACMAMGSGRYQGSARLLSATQSL